MHTATEKAIFPLAVESGPYRFAPPTLLHLAALDRLGCSIGPDGRIGADYCASAGFLLGLSFDELAELMSRPSAEIRAEAAAWAARQSVRDYASLHAGVVRAVNAAYETAVPGSDADFPEGLKPTSAGS